MRGRPRTPTKVLEMRGAYERNPQRRKDREGEPDNLAPVGEAPPALDETQRARWDELVLMYPWARHSDRLLLEQTAIVWALMRSGKAKPADMKLLQTNIRCLGGTPADVSKVRMPSGKGKTKLSKFA